MTNMRVLLTGATGYIASQLLPAFQERYDLQLLDVREADGSGCRVEGVEVADLLGEEDSSKLEQLFASADVVVHTGYRKATGTDPQSQYDVERTNVDMMQVSTSSRWSAGCGGWWPPAPTRRPSGTNNPTSPG